MNIHRSTKSRSATWYAGVLARALGAMLFVTGAARAQATDAPAPPPVRWHLHVGGDPAPWPIEEALPADSLDAAVARILAGLRAEGHYFARLDSATIDTTRVPAAVHLYTTRGPEVLVGEVVVRGNRALETERLLALMETRAGRILDRRRLEGDLAAMLDRYEAAGYPLAQIRVAGLGPVEDDPARLRVELEVEEGETMVLERIELVGATRTRASYAARLADLRPGDRLDGYAAEAVRERLERAGVFAEVGEPELRLVPDSGAVLRIPVEEAPPGTFDLVLGYLPPSGAGASGRLVGNGHLELRNLFGRGRALSVRLDRRPGQVSSVEAEASDPYLFGLPLGVSGSFSGLQEDSTFGKQVYRGAASYRLRAGVRVRASLAREVTRPGEAGTGLVLGRQRIPRAEASFVGLGLAVERVDRPANPQRGYSFGVEVERGTKARRFARAEAHDTVTVASRLGQSRLSGRGRLYVPVRDRQALVLGAGASALLSDEYDRSDLFRLGGAASLRGYDEDRFVGRHAGRLLAEYRYRLDRLSYAFLFFDLGYVDTPAVEEEGIEAARGVHPGYGVGMQFSTRLGLVNVSAALNPEDGPTGARIHAGLSFGL